jgi:hypothetical protein
MNMRRCMPAAASRGSAPGPKYSARVGWLRLSGLSMIRTLGENVMFATHNSIMVIVPGAVKPPGERHHPPGTG